VLGLILDPTVLYAATVAGFAVWLLVLGNRRGGRPTESATSPAVTASLAVSANEPEALDQQQKHDQEHGHRKDRATDRPDLSHTLPSASA